LLAWEGAGFIKRDELRRSPFKGGARGVVERENCGGGKVEDLPKRGFQKKTSPMQRRPGGRYLGNSAKEGSELQLGLPIGGRHRERGDYTGRGAG